MRNKILIQVFLSIIILLIFIIVYQKYFKKELEKKTPINNEKNTKQENNLINITYDSVDREGRKYIITTETGTFREQETDLIYMTNVSAKIILLDGTRIFIESSNAKYNSLSYDTKFQKDVKLRYLNNNIFCENLNIFFKRNLIEAFNNLNYKNSDIIMGADKIEIDLLTKNSKIYNFNENNVIIKNKSSDGNN